jgi:hypothetical protein
LTCSSIKTSYTHENGHVCAFALAANAPLDQLRKFGDCNEMITDIGCNGYHAAYGWNAFRTWRRTVLGTALVELRRRIEGDPGTEGRYEQTRLCGPRGTLRDDRRLKCHNRSPCVQRGSDFRVDIEKATQRHRIAPYRFCALARVRVVSSIINAHFTLFFAMSPPLDQTNRTEQLPTPSIETWRLSPPATGTIAASEPDSTTSPAFNDSFS